MRVKYLKIVSYLSLIFMTTNFILCINGLKCINGFAFLWMILIMAIMCSEVQINKAFRITCGVLIFIPIFFSQGITYKVSIVIVGALLIYFHKKFVLEINYDQVLYQLKIAFILNIIMILSSYLAADSETVNNYIVPYAILFIIFDITLLRTMRNYKYNVVNKKIRKINTAYLLFIAAFSAVLSVKQIRDIMASGALLVYQGIAFVITKIGLLLSYCLFKILPHFSIKQETVDKFFNSFSMIYGKSNNKQNLNEGLKRVQPMLQLQSLLVKAVIIIVIVALFVYMFKMQYKRKKETADFIETREAIKIIGDNGRRRTSIYDKLKKGSYKDKIRYYYYKFLQDCIKKDIDIRKSDTTKDINNKAEISFDQNKLSNMRNVYLKAKYTENECTAEDFKDFNKNYKEK